MKHTQRTPWLTVALALALAVSVSLHIARLARDAGDEGPRVVALTQEGPAARPTLLIDFDVPMVTAGAVGQPLAEGLVHVDPPTATVASFLTPRRLSVQVERPLPLFQHGRVLFGPAFHDATGRPLASAPPTVFTTGQLELERPPRARFAKGIAVCSLAFNGPVAPNVLREHLHVKNSAGRDLTFELRGEDAAWDLAFEDVPRGPTRLTIDAGLPSRLGPVGLAKCVDQSLVWPSDLLVVDTDVSGKHPRRTVELTFSHDLADGDLSPFVSVDPAPEDLQVKAAGSTLALTASFPARRVARVRLRKGLPSSSGLTLAADVLRPVSIPAPRPRVRIAQAGSALSTAARPELMLEGINVPLVEVSLREVFPNNIVPLALDWAQIGAFASDAVVRRVPIQTAPDEAWTHRLDLTSFLGKPPRGVYHITVRDAEASSWRSSTRLLQVTDLAPVVRVAPEGLVVCVFRLSDGSAVAQATVQAFDEKNQRVASGVTDEDGLFRATYGQAAPHVVVVSTAEDRAWVDLRTHALAHDPRDIEGRRTPQGLEAFLYADRGVVRPAEVAHVTALVRMPDGTAGPAGLPLSLELHGPGRRVLKRLKTRTDPHGMAAIDIPFALDAPTGPYLVTVKTPGSDAAIGEVAFRVETIVPDRLEGVIALPDEPLRPSATVQAKLAATLLSGEPVGGLTARLRVRHEPRVHEDAEGFVFGDRFSAPAPFAAPEEQRVLDAAGKATVEVELPSLPEAGVDLRTTFELEVIDVSGRGVFTRVVRDVRPGEPRLGLAPPRGGAVELDLKLAGGERAAGLGVLERVRRIGSWRFEGSRFVWRGDEVVTPVAQVSFQLEDGRGRVRFENPGDGRFRVRVEAPGTTPAAVAFERWGGVTYASSKPGAPRLTVSLVGKDAQPGGRVALAVDAPVAGRALLTVESTSVLSARVVPIEAGPQHVWVDLPDVELPSVHVTLTLVRGAREAAGRPTRLLGAVAVPLRRPARRLAVELDVPAEAEPERSLALTVRTSAPATVRVHLVDEGLLRLTGYRSPDPVARLEATRRLDTRLGDLYAALLERMVFGSEEAETGGGGSLAGRLDPTATKTLETVAIASRLVPCNGEVHLDFDLPAYEGRLRVFVVAAGAQGTGSASAPLAVKGRISVAIHTPRAVAPGDVFEVPIQVRGEEVTWDVALVRLERVSDGAPLRVRAGTDPGVARIVVRAHDAAGHAVEREARFSIRPAAPLTLTHDVTRVAAGERIDARVPGSWLPGHAKARLVVGDVPGLASLPALERLLEYPHGCVEQTTSRAFVLLAWSALLRRTHPEGAAPEDVVGAAIDRILSMQTAEGALAAWPGGSRPYAFGSTYGAHFLVEARRLGRAVPEEPLTRLLDVLEKRLRRGKAGAYTARVLALADRDVRVHLPGLADDASTAEERADLAAAYLLTGDRQQAHALLRGAGDPWGVPREYGGRLSSPVRAAATLLGALAEVSPEDSRLPDLTARLEAELQGTRRTTQDDAAALLALAKVYAMRASGPPSRGRVRVGNVEHVYGAGGLVLPFDPAAAPSYTLDADGPTTLVVRVAGIPLEPPAQGTSKGVTVTRRYEASDGAFQQGRIYQVVIEGRAPPGAENLLVTDVLPGGLEIEAARGQSGTLDPDRIEPRDDRVLFFRTKPLADGTFRQTYLVRAVTAGTFRAPPVRAELLYAPDLHACSEAGGSIEVRR